MADSDAPGYPKLSRNTVVRRKPRGKYDYKTIHEIVNTTPILHVSFPTPDPSDPFPAMLPMLGFMGVYANPDAGLEEQLDLYLHGYISSRLMRLGGATSSNNEDDEDGLPLTVGATHLDGLVLALTPNNPSYNYRSAVLHGFATAVTDTEEKLWAMERITNIVVPDRWAHTRVPPNKTEMTSTQILRVRIVDASAKIRAAWPGDDRVDMKDDEVRARVWTGVVPTWMVLGEPLLGPENRVAQVPEHVQEFVKRENKIREKNALAFREEK